MLNKIMTSLLFGALLTGASAYAHTMQEIAGFYDDSSVDTISYHGLLPNGDYCYMAVMGSVDLHLAGRWKTGSSSELGTLITFLPESLMKTRYPAWIDRAETGDNRTLIFSALPFMTSSHEVFVGFGATSDQPQQFAPLLNAKLTHYPNSFVIPSTANYLFVGHKTDEGTFELTRYPLAKDSKHPVHLSYDANAAYAEVFKRLQGRYKDNAITLELDGRVQGPTPKTAWKDDREISDAREKCVSPIVNGKPSDVLPKNSELLTPTTLMWQGKPTGSPWQGMPSASSTTKGGRD